MPLFKGGKQASHWSLTQSKLVPLHLWLYLLPTKSLYVPQHKCKKTQCNFAERWMRYKLGVVFMAHRVAVTRASRVRKRTFSLSPPLSSKALAAEVGKKEPGKNPAPATFSGCGDRSLWSRSVRLRLSRLFHFFTRGLQNTFGRLCSFDTLFSSLFWITSRLKTNFSNLLGRRLWHDRCLGPYCVKGEDLFWNFFSLDW